MPGRSHTALYPTGPSPDVLVRIEQLCVTFGTRRILRGVDLKIHRGETLVIIGGSGSGKSTLLRAMIGAIPHCEGNVELFHDDIYQLPEEELNAIRRRFGILFQSGALLGSMSVGENVALPLREHTDLDEDLIRSTVRSKLDQVGLRGSEEQMPSELSGGMRKRVGLARALALDPELLFYDEPGAGLDPISSAAIDQLITALPERTGVTSVVVTHDMGKAFRIGDRLVFLYDGRIRAEGTPEAFQNSHDPLLQQFIRGEAEPSPIVPYTERAGDLTPA